MSALLAGTVGAVATIPVQQVTHAGLASATGFQAATAADKFQPGATTVLEVINTGGSPCDVVVDSKVPSNYGTDVNVGPVTVPATTGRVEIGPFPPQRFAGSDGMADVTFSFLTGVTVRAKRL